jgi:hypothetical protein
MLKIALILACMMSVFTLSGCNEPQVRSPFSNELVTAATLEREADTAIEQREKAIERDRAKQQAELAKIKREAEANLAKLDLTQQAERIDITTNLDARLAEVEAKYAEQQADADKAWAAIENRFAEASESLKRQHEQRAAGLQVLQTGLSAVPAAAPFAGLLSDPTLLALLGIGGGYAVRSRMKKAEDKAWDEAKSDADKESAKRDATWDQSEQAALLKSLIGKLAGGKSE